MYSLYGAGIIADTVADTTGYSKSGLGTGGTATAHTTITNLGTVESDEPALASTRPRLPLAQVARSAMAARPTLTPTSPMAVMCSPAMEVASLVSRTLSPAAISANTAIGGHATATTIVTNNGKVFAGYNNGSGITGVYGGANAYANAWA